MANVGYATLQIIPSMRGVHQKISSDLTGIANQAGAQAGSQMGSAMGRAMSRGVEIAAKATAATVAATTGVAVASLISGYQRMTTIQDSAAALTISLGDSAAAASLLDDVLGVVRGTPFNLDHFAAGAQQLAGMGIEADKIPGYLTAIGEAAATQGSRANEMSGRLMTVFGQIQAQGQVTLQDIWRISDTGVNALAILGNHYGVTTDQMKRMISEGAVPASEALDVLAEGIMEGTDGVAGRTVALAGTMEALRRTVSGSVSGIEPAMARMGAAFIEPFSPLIIAGANALADTFDTLGDRFGDLAARISQTDAFESLVGWLERAPAALDGLLDSLAPAAPVIAATAAGLTMFGTAASGIPLLGPLAASVHPLAAAFTVLALATPEARDALADVIQAAAPLAQELAAKLLPILENLGEIAASVLPAAIDLFGTALQGVLTVAIPLADIVASLTGFLADHAGIVAAVAAAYVGWKAAVAGAAAWSAAAAAVQKLTTAFQAAQAMAPFAGRAAQGFGALRTSLAGVSGAAGPAGIAVAGFAAIVGYSMVSKSNAARASMERATEAVNEFTESLNIDPTNLDSIVRAVDELRVRQQEAAAVAEEMAWVIQTPAYRDAANEARLLGDEIDDLSEGYVSAMGNMATISARTGMSFDEIKAKAQEMGIDLTASGVAGQDAAQEIIDGFNAANSAVRGQVVGSAFREMADAADEAAVSVSDWRDALDRAMGVQPDLIDAQIRHQDALAKATEALKENGTTFDLSTEAGRENATVLRSLTDAGLALAEAEGEVAGSTEHATNVTALHREQMVRLMEQFGSTRAEAEDYINQLGLTPDVVSTLVDLETDQARRAVANMISLIAGIPSAKDIVAIAHTAQAYRDMNALVNHPWTIGITARVTSSVGSIGGSVGLAGGGYLDQRFGGIPGRDSIPAMLMPGEFVMRKSAVDRLGVQFLDKLNKGLPGYAAGGYVRTGAMRSARPPATAAMTHEPTRTGPAVQFSGPIHLHDEVDIDMLDRRMSFAARARSL